MARKTSVKAELEQVAKLKKRGGSVRKQTRTGAIALDPATEKAKRQSRFLACYAKVGTITGAARAAGIAPGTHYEWLDFDPSYPKRFEAAYEQSMDAAEAELRRRGIQGVQEAIYYQGEVVGYKRNYSDACLIFLLKNRRPEVFRDVTALTGADGGPLSISWDTTPVNSPKLPLDPRSLVKAAKKDAE